mmetsp:Transcript_112086/g.280823  ORF Transcript_112086/g.280823 Transcript_112086/m.280823 type:complete len:1246 (+) Transcript_112086:407-4144(+)
MQLSFDGLGEASAHVSVMAGVRTEVKIGLRGIRRSLHLGDQVGCELHWACLDDTGAWTAPAAQPDGSRSVDPVASRIECRFDCVMGFPKDMTPKKIVFVVVVHANGQQHWLKAPGGSDFVLDLEELAAQAPPTPVALTPLSPGAGASFGTLGAVRVAERPKEWPALKAAMAATASTNGATNGKANGATAKGKKKADKPKVTQGVTDLEGGIGKVAWHVVTFAEALTVFVETSLPLPEQAQLFLHMGCQAAPGAEWELPEEPLEGTVPFGDGKATRVPMSGQSRAELKFKAKSAPGALAFVLYACGGGGEQWLKASGGGDFGIPLGEGSAAGAAVAGPGEEIARNFVDAETKYSHWSQFQRLCMVKDIFCRPEPLNATEAAWVACDLRLANQKALEWYRQRGYQPKDMAHCQEALGGAMATAVGAAADPTTRALMRLAVRACPRGNSSGGDAIRHGILNIMRTHGIREGHRPGIECKFIEQWHQKLHTNSAPDDIAICEGYLAFLSSGNPDDLFRTVWERASITREDMAKMAGCGFKDHTKSGAAGLNVNPVHLPQLYNDMQGYLGLLKHVHGGTDLFALCEGCKGQYPDHGCECLAFEIFHERDSPFVMGKIIDLRRRLESCLWKRDILMLDVALEDQLRLVAERQDLGSMGRDDLINFMGCLLKDLQLSRRDPSVDMGLELFFRLSEGDHGGAQRWGTDWCKLMLAACDRLSVICAGVADTVAELLQSCADRLRAGGERPGAVFRPDPKILGTFGEETARCLSERLVAQCLRGLQPQLRRGAGLGPWELVSAGAGVTVGTVEAMKALPVELPAGKGPILAVTETLTGWEDIPAGISAVLLPAAHAVDVLSHVAIRARNQKVLLASCDDDALLAELRGKNGAKLKLSVGPSGDVTWAVPSANELASAGGSAPTSAAGGKQLAVKRPPAPPALVLPISKFEAHRKSLGGKSFHLSELKPKGGEYQVPPSATVPFGTFEELLQDPANEDFREQLEELTEEGEWAKVRSFVVDELQVPAKLEAAVVEQMATLGAPIPAGVEWQRALKGVWASKWTDRAVSSRRQMGVPEDNLVLAVLVQPLAFASYAFVIHTRSPMAGANKEDALVEVVVGLGESLVSNSPGRALSASVGPAAGGAIEVHTYPSKPTGVFTPEGGTHIFRSDSNGEDLEGFAGAGLYDSITVAPCPHRPVAYASEPLVFDAAFRNKLLRRLFDLGRLVEANFNGQPQDIEGAVLKDGSLVVLQSRPQV